VPVADRHVEPPRCALIVAGEPLEIRGPEDWTDLTEAESG
jgi:hypothetical protein